MLKLPAIKRRPMASLATTDPMSPVREANSRAAALATIGKAAGQATQMISDYAKRVNQDDIRNATLAVHQEDAAFRGAHEGAEEFDIMAVEDDNFINIADGLGYEDPESPVPAHRVYAEWRKQNYDDSIKRAASGIRDTRAKDAFLREHQAKGASAYATDSIQSAKKQIQYTAKKTMAMVDESILKKDFQGARIAVLNANMSEARTDAAYKSINLQEQNDYFEEVLEKKDVQVMEGALNQLIENDPKVTSELKQNAQTDFANQLRTAIGTAKNANTAGANASLKLMREDLKRQTEDLQSGKTIDDTRMKKNMAALGLSSPVLVQTAKWTRDNQEKVSSVLHELPEVQAAIYEELLETSEGGAEDSFLIRQIGRAIEEDRRLYKVDAMKRANDTGFIVLEQMDYSSPEAIGVSLAKRLKQATSIRSDHRAFTGYFTEEGLAEFGNFIENESMPDQLDIFGSIHESLGKNASSLYEQLKVNGVAGTAAIAGQLVARGPQYRVAAENVLKGAELRKTNTITQLKVKEADLDPVILESFGLMFAGNQKHQSLMAEAFKDVWAVTENSQVAFEQLVGDVIEYQGGAVIQAPAPGIGYYKYDWHLKDILPEWWAGDNMKAYGYSPEQLRSGVLDGSLLQIGVGDGVNNLLKSDGSVVTRPDGETALPFAIDMKEPTKGARDKEHTKKLRSTFNKQRAEKAAKRATEIMEAWSEVGTI